jgi:hypothetical protein
LPDDVNSGRKWLYAKKEATQEKQELIIRVRIVPVEVIPIPPKKKQTTLGKRQKL